MAKMLKQLGSLALALVMILSMIPAAYAAETTILVGSTEEWDAQIDALQSATKAMTVNMKFTADIVATKELVIPYGINHNVTIDMDGHKLTSTDAIRAFNLHEGTLTLLNGTVEMPGLNETTAGSAPNDSQDYEFAGLGGIILAYKADVNLKNVTVKKVKTDNAVASAGIVYIRSASTITLTNSHLVVEQDDTYDANSGGVAALTNYSGQPILKLINSTISGGYVKNYGGNIMMSGSGKLEIDKDSAIFGGKVGKETTYGGGNIYCGNKNTRIYLNGGQIYGGITEGGNGGNLRINAGKLYMDGGKIYGGIAKAASDSATKNCYGGNIFLNHAEGGLYMDGGEIYGGLAESYAGYTVAGGNIYSNLSEIVMDGGAKVYDGTATTTVTAMGGNIYLTTGNFTLNDGEIYNGMVTSAGNASKASYAGNLYVVGSSTVTINGGKIYDGSVISTNYSAHGGNIYMTRGGSSPNYTYPVFVINGGEITGGYIEGTKEIYGAAFALYMGRLIINGGRIGTGSAKKLTSTTGGGSTGIQIYNATLADAAGDTYALRMYGGILESFSSNKTTLAKLHAGKTGGNYSKFVGTCSEATTEKVDGYYVITHKNTDGTDNDVAATCTATGTVHVTCADCALTVGSTTYGGTYSHVAPATGHTAGEPVVENEVAGTCAAEGSYDTVVYCTVCEAEISRETTTMAAAGHTAGEEVTENEVAATCTTDGSYDTVVYCTVCGGEMSRTTHTVSATGHNEVVDAAVAATCETDGLTEGKHCATCGTVTVAQDTVAALGHSWDKGVIDPKPTCNDDGVKTFTCSACGETKTEAVSATGHKAVTDAAVAPTCTENGLTAGSHCETCGTVIVAQEVVPATGHTAGQEVTENEVAATCTTDGSYDTVVYCTVCNAEVSRETTTVTAIGHTEVVDKAVAADCVNDGLTEGKHCSVCNAVIVAQETVPAIGHDYEDVYTEPTYEADAYTTYTCANCGDTYIETHEGTQKIGAAKIGNVTYATLADAVAAAQANETVVLMMNVELTETLVVAADKTITLDLCGNTITGTDNNTSDDFYLIHNRGDLTIADSVGTGAITLTATTDRSWYAFSAVIANYPGNLTVEGGAIEHLGGTAAAIGILNMTNWKLGDATTTVNGGSVHSSYFAICQFANSETCENTLVINGGEVGYAWMQSANRHVNQATTTVTGGYVYGIRITGENADVELSVAEASVGEITGTMPANQALVLENGIYTLAAAVAQVGEQKYASLQDAINAANGQTVVVLEDIDLGATTVKVSAGTAVTLDLNGNTISGVCNTNQGTMIHVANTADLTVVDSAEGGKITYASGASATGFGIYVEGNLILESGIIELTGSWSLGFAVDVHPNAWSTAYTEGASFVMNGGKVVSSDTAVRVDYNSSNVHPAVTSTFIMNGGVIESDWDAVFIQHRNPYSGIMNVTINAGEISGKNSPLRIYGDVAVNDVTMNIGGGTFHYTGAAGTSGWIVPNVLKGTAAVVAEADIAITGGTFDGDVSQFCAEGYGCTANTDGTYGIHQHNVVTDAAVAPTCTEDGLTEGKHCDICGTVIVAQETIPATGHDYEDVYTAPTFEADGYTTYTCENCGDSYTETDEGTMLTAVASADGVFYGSLQEALTAGGYVKLLQNIVATEKLTAPATATLDLNGFTLTLCGVDGNYGLVVSGNLTITGKGVVVANGTYGIGVTGSLTVESGTFRADSKNDYLIGNWGTTVINGGTFTGTYNCVNNFKGTTSVYGGTFRTKTTDYTGNYESADLLADSGLTVYGGTFSKDLEDSFIAPNYAFVKGKKVVKLADALSAGEVTLMGNVTMDEKLSVNGYARLNLNGFTLNLADVDGNYALVVNGNLLISGEGTVNAPSVYGIGVMGSMVIDSGNFVAGAKSDYLIGNWGTTVINGGTFNGVYCCVNNFKGTTDIYNGTFTTEATDSTGTYESADLLADAGLTVYGGIYSKPVDAAFCPEGYSPKANDDGTYTIARAVVIAKAPEDAAVEPTVDAQFKVEAVGDGLTYKWQYKSASGNKWYDTKLTGYNTDTLTVKVYGRNGYQYRCVVNDAYGNQVVTDAAILTVIPPADAVKITTNPANVAVTTGENAIFTVAAEGTDVTYQWQYSRNGSTWYDTAMEGNNTATLTVEATIGRNGYQYRCVVNDANGYSAVSAAAVLTVGNGSGESDITGPQDQTATSGTAVFTVEAAEGCTYTWQYQRADGTKWFFTTMEGYNTNELTVTVTASRDGYKYRCIIVDSNGNEYVTEAATLHVG